MNSLVFYTFTSTETDKIAVFLEDVLNKKIQALPDIKIPTWEEQFECFWSLIALELTQKLKTNHSSCVINKFFKDKY